MSAAHGNVVDDDIDDILDEIMDDFDADSTDNTNIKDVNNTISSINTEAVPVGKAAADQLAHDVQKLQIDLDSTVSSINNPGDQGSNTLAQLSKLLANDTITGNGTSTDKNSTNASESDKQFDDDIENILMKALMGDVAAAGSPQQKVQQDLPAKPAKSMKDHVAQTMSRMKDSSQKAQEAEINEAAASKAAASMDPLAALAGLNGLGGLTGNPDDMSDEAIEMLMKQMAAMDPNIAKLLESAELNGEQNAEASETDQGEKKDNGQFDGLLETLMSQLVSRDVLLDPMRQLDEKYPKWLEANKSKISASDYNKYVAQHNVVKKIVFVFESDKNTTGKESQETTEEVMTLMQKMQEYGNPPEEIMTELAKSSGADPNLLFATAPTVNPTAAQNSSQKTPTSIPGLPANMPEPTKDELAQIDALISGLLNQQGAGKPNTAASGAGAGPGMNDADIAKLLSAALGGATPGAAGANGANPNECPTM